MKTLVTVCLLSVMCLGCERGRFDVSNPDVMEFVKQLKNGTYDQYEWTEEGDRLWTIMPAFQKKDIPALISLAKDSELVSPCDHFPVNPISSMWPFRVVDGKECIMLGEYLLWCAEAVIEGKDFASLNPVLRNTGNSSDQRLDAGEIMAVRKIYQEWWDEYGHQADPLKLPLEGTVYSWR
ncbi:MAG: DUF4943 family protein [Bacteroidales bacterium]|nr:DUF4943 family protein [Bacteroidales bacterium]NLD63305.1 DUF4943 family protein [Bacteroidales bacterium]HOO67180.1 DUF4943 family protein [Bacteroidales bacterium]HPE23374.1 DUF4943 family protein [Bacteroidales bacterium]HPJ05899.1 DUF4943 family protein [Bacteroidales bacterium]